MMLKKLKTKSVLYILRGRLFYKKHKKTIFRVSIVSSTLCLAYYGRSFMTDVGA